MVGRKLSWVFVLAMLGCAAPARVTPGSAVPAVPAAHANVEPGSLVQSNATITLDVLVPPEGDVQGALTLARSELAAKGRFATGTAALVSTEDEHWSHRLPGYVTSRIDREAFARVDRSVAVVRIDARAPAARGWELIANVTEIAKHVAASQQGWIYDAYRAELDDVHSMDSAVPDPGRRDVRSIVRVMGVTSTKGELDHVRTIGLWRLGLPELYASGIPGPNLDQAIELVRATAQILIQTGDVTRSGVIEVDRSQLPSGWPRATSGSGKLTWAARWLRGPIHDHAMIIELSIPASTDTDPKALVTAFRAYFGSDP